jgi:very-short-patch-repair endonuclease
MRGKDDTDHRIAAYAAANYGVVSFAELRSLGLGEDAVDHRLVRGRLHRRHKGVYTVGHPLLSLRGRWRAAVLACGDGAVLSHSDAAALWDLQPSRDGRIHVIRPSTSGRDPDPARIHLHRVGTFRAWEGTVTDGIPTTTVARTLLDLAPKLRPAALEDVIGRADRLGLFHLLAVRRCLAEHPRQHGAPRLRRLLDDLAGVGAADLRSTLEVRLLQLCVDHDLPRPRVNARVAGFMVDFLWPDANLIVETDGYAYHSSREAFERDRERDQRLTLAGYTVVRFTYNQVTKTPEAVANRLRRLMRIV